MRDARLSRSVLGALSLALVLIAAGCGGSVTTEEDAARVLSDAGRPENVRFEHGGLQFSKQIPGVATPSEGRLAGTSWDVYYVLDDGEVGAWGAGMDVFDSDAAANRAAGDLADFWVCDGPREAFDVDADGYDVVEASTCKRPTEGGYYAMLSVADGPVTANLLVASRERALAVQALTTAWGSLSASTQDVLDDVS